MSDPVQDIILAEIKDLRKDVKDLRKDLYGFKIKVVGFITVLLTAAEVVKIYISK